MRKKHIYIVGLDDFNLRTLRALEDAGKYVFHELFSPEELSISDTADFEALLRTGEARLAGARERADAIVGYWDFPTSVLTPLLANRCGLVAPSMEAIFRCEHKYWSRLAQRDVIPEHIPDFVCIDPFDEDFERRLPFEPPFWIKPVKAWSSQLGFKIRSRADLHRALAKIRKGIGRIARPFNQALAHADLPHEVARYGGRACMVEKLIGGFQCTLEGFAFKGEIGIHGVVDSVRHSNGSTFSRYQYPSELPPRATEKMADIAKRFMKHIGFDNGTFNIELFYDEPADRVWLLEVNPRISQSHAQLFAKVDGAANHEQMIDIALGREPRTRREGRYNCAAKLFYRTTREDAIVVEAPTPEEVRALERRLDGVDIDIVATPRTQLSTLPDQDSYSYELALIYIGAEDEGEMLQKYQECVDTLRFSFADVSEPKRRVKRQSFEQLPARRSFASIH